MRQSEHAISSLVKRSASQIEGKDGQESFQEGTCVEPKPIPGHQDTNTSHGHIQTSLDDHLTLEPMHTHHAPYIQAKDLRTSKY